MWRRCECPRFTLPVAVFLKRLAAPLWVFSFGIVPRSQTAGASCQPSVLVVYSLISGIFRSTGRRAKSAKPDLALRRLLLPPPVASRPQAQLPSPAFLKLASLFPAPAFSPASPFASLPVLFLFRARPPFSSAPEWRAACCLPVAAETPRCCAARRL